MIPIFWVVVLLSPFAHANGNFSNSTLQSSIVKLNLSSSLTATGDNGEKKCFSLVHVWFSSATAFYTSLSLAAANGDYTYSSKINTAFNYSSLLYTLVDGNPRLSLIPTATYLSTSLYTPEFTMPFPNCSKVRHGNCGKCSLGAGVVEVNYWPIKTVSSHPNMTITSKDAERVTTVMDGVTLTSPTVYLSFSRLGTWDSCNTGTNIQTMIGVDPSGLSSIEYGDGGYTTLRPFNFNDLNDPVPARAYLGQLGCHFLQPRCLTIRPDDYHPALAVPSEIKSLLPGWEDCEVIEMTDPPRILQPAQALAGPTSELNADPPSPTNPRASFRPLGPVRTADPHIVFSPPAAPDAPPKKGDTSVKDPAHADPSVKNPAAPDSPDKNTPASNSPDKNTPAQNSQDKNTPAQNSPDKSPPAPDPLEKSPPAPGSPNNSPSAPGSPDKIPPGPGSPDNSPAAQNSPANNSPENDGLTRDPDGSGGLSSGREAAIITLGSQTYTANANSDFIIDSKILSVGGPVAIVSGQTVSLNTKGVILEGTMHAFSTISPIQPKLNTAEARLYTGPGGKKVIVIGSSTLSTGGEAGNVGGQTLSVGANGIMIGSKTIDFSTFEPSKPTSGGLMIGGKSFSLAGIHRLTSPGELQMLHTSAFPPASPNTVPNLSQVLPTVVIVSAEKITADPAGQYLVGGKTFTLKRPYTPGAADLATTMISDALVTSAARAPPTIAGAPLEPPGSSSFTPVGLGQQIFDAFVRGGSGGSGEGGGGQGKEGGGGQGATSGPAAGSNNTGGETGEGVMAYTGRAAGRFSYHYSGWLLMVGAAATLGWR